MKAKGKHIAMFSALNPGHVYPALGLCSELVRRGHRITYPTSDCFAEEIRQTGAHPLVFRVPSLTNVEMIWQLPLVNNLRSWQLYASIFEPLRLSIIAATVAETEGFYRDNPPDLIVYDWDSFAGKIVGRMLNRPAVHVHAHFAQQGFLIREDGVCMNPSPMLGFAHLLDSLLSAYGIEETGNLWHREDLNIIFVPREFQFDPASFDDRFHFVGPCLNRPTRSAWKNISHGKPVLLISESAFAKGDGAFLRICIEAFADCEYHVVFSVGANTQQIERCSVPKNFEINKDAYNLEVLPHAAAVVCHSGMGIVLESLHFGVPIVAIPNPAYNSEVAYRVAELGLGIHLRDCDVSSNSLRASVGALMTDTVMRERLKVMQKNVRNSGGAELAADLLEGALRSTRSRFSV